MRFVLVFHAFCTLKVKMTKGQVIRLISFRIYVTRYFICLFKSWPLNYPMLSIYSRVENIGYLKMEKECVIMLQTPNWKRLSSWVIKVNVSVNHVYGYAQMVNRLLKLNIHPSEWMKNVCIFSFWCCTWNWNKHIGLLCSLDRNEFLNSSPQSNLYLSYNSSDKNTNDYNNCWKALRENI